MDYKKILEGVVDIINTAEKSDIGFANICTYIGENCPELKESEDERIRKWLIAQLEIKSGSNDADRENMILKAITWLEKQGREKPQRMISAEAKEAMYDKPAWNEKDEKEYKYVLKFVDNVLNNCGNKKDYEHCKRCYDWLKSLKQKIGSKQ